MPSGFSSLVEPCAHAICARPAERREAGAYPAARWLAVGTSDGENPCELSAVPVATKTAPAVTAAAAHAPSARDPALGKDTVETSGSDAPARRRRVVGDATFTARPVL